MRDRAVRRHHEFIVKRKVTKHYNSCILKLSADDRQKIEGNVEKIRKTCSFLNPEGRARKLVKKTIQERRHDITMREELI